MLGIKITEQMDSILDLHLQCVYILNKKYGSVVGNCYAAVTIGFILELG